MVFEQLIGNDQPENGIAEEFESFVGLLIVIGGAGERAVGEAKLEQRDITEMIAEESLDPFESWDPPVVTRSSA